MRDKGVKKKLFSNLVEQEGGASSGKKNIQLEAVVIKPVFYYDPKHISLLEHDLHLG